MEGRTPLVASIRSPLGYVSTGLCVPNFGLQHGQRAVPLCRRGMRTAVMWTRYILTFGT